MKLVHQKIVHKKIIHSLLQKLYACIPYMETIKRVRMKMLKECKGLFVLVAV